MRTLTLIIIVFFLTCSSAFSAALTIVLFDLSGSVLVDNFGQEGKDSPYHKNVTELNKLIYKLNKNETILVVGFGRKSDVVLLKATMPKQAGAMNAKLNSTREAAIRKFQDNMENKSGVLDKSRTDVIGGILRASRMFAENSEASSKHLIILSDMLDNENAGLSIARLKFAGSHKAYLKKLEGKILVPDLKGVEIDLYSVFTDVKETNTVETEVAIKELKSFWSEYFRKSGGLVKSFKTSY